jgi:WD40 repeat protein
MSGFGGRGQHQHSNANTNTGAGGRGTGRGSGRGGRGYQGRNYQPGRSYPGSNYQGNNYQGHQHQGHQHTPNRKHPDARLKPCAPFTNTGSCPNGNCGFAHVVKLHASIDASIPDQNANKNDYNNRNNNNNRQMSPISSVSIWETAGAIKIFTGSHDGFWRLWNTQGGTFVKEFEQSMGGPVECVEVASNFLFCGFEGTSPALPGVQVGMIHAWNLSNPNDPPLEFHMHALIPYAHATRLTKLLVVDGQKIISGSRDGALRMWAFDAAAHQGKGGFVLALTLLGHAREITGLSVADNLLWSSSTDGSIRIWDLANNGECQHAITMAPANPQQSSSPPPGAGHKDAVTDLISFTSPSGKFILSSSLDGDIKAWNGSNGQCVASESHGEGVVSMSMGKDLNNNQLLLIGLVSGNIMIRSILQTPNVPAFTLLATLSSHFTAGHEGSVKTICEGPASTFYSGGSDGKVLVFQFTGDLGL